MIAAGKHKIEFIDLKAQQNRIRDILEKRIKRVLDHGIYILGPEVQELEERLADLVGSKHCIACASGTDALLMALMAYDVGPGDAIFTTPFTFIATAEVISLLGATPVFVDIDPKTFNLNAQKLQETIHTFIQRNGSLQPKGVIPVNLFGQPADYDAIRKVAETYRLFVLEDAAQSLGAEYKGRKAGNLGDIGATSFFPAKPLGCYGDGGALFCNDDTLAEKLRSIRVHGKGLDKYENIRIGINGRLDTLQAAILLAKLEIFEEEIILRNEVARRYSEGLQGKVITPWIEPDRTSVWAQYSVLSDNRDNLMKKLKLKGIPTAIYYPKPLHLQEAFRSLSYKQGDFPVSEKIANSIFSLPMHPYLSTEDQEYILEAFND
jgi:UDP-2-acetamido-2-deoxy-ribo-hexuluronate aminotransferase